MSKEIKVKSKLQSNSCGQRRMAICVNWKCKIWLTALKSCLNNYENSFHQEMVFRLQQSSVHKAEPSSLSEKQVLNGYFLQKYIFQLFLIFFFKNRTITEVMKSLKSEDEHWNRIFSLHLNQMSGCLNFSFTNIVSFCSNLLAMQPKKMNLLQEERLSPTLIGETDSNYHCFKTCQ